MSLPAKRRFINWLIAAALLLAQTAAIAHEYDHALNKHDAPCALHAYCEHAGKALVGNAPAAVLPELVGTALAASGSTLTSRVIAAYAARAPPSLAFVRH
jgi:hypothetical protein